MGTVKSAIKRMKQRSKLPSGDKIVTIHCEECNGGILCWNDDPILSPYYTYRVLCTQCRAADRAENRAIFGK
jgi:hypothetical protein